MKKLFAVLIASVMMLSTVSSAFAENIGTVDFERLIRSYTKAQSFSDDSKLKEQELATMRTEFIKQLREAKNAQSNNPVALEKLEKELQTKLDARINETRNWMASKSKELDESIQGAIKTVVVTKKLDIVIAKQSVLHGGTDITGDVISILNQ